VRALAKIAVGAGILVVTLIVIAAAVVAAAGILYDHRKPQLTAGGLRRDTAQYIRMSDGTPIAVDIWLPPTLATGQRVPVLIKATPYWRGSRPGFLGKALVELGAPAPGEMDIPALNRRGFAIMVVDTRGTGASFGAQKAPFDDREIGDYGELIDWAARQPWSSGAVGAYGFSYRGMLAVDMASLGKRSLRAVAPSFDFTDLYLVVHPGGVFASYFANAWGALTAGLNRGLAPCSGLICHLIVAGPKPVDADTGGALLKEAIAAHAADYDMAACARAAPNRDDKICSSGKSLTDVSEIARQKAIEAPAIPIYAEVGYFDEVSPAEAVRRFQTFSNPQTLIIGPFSHGGFESTDPYRPSATHAEPDYLRQVGRMADFFDRYLKPGAPGAVGNRVDYFVLGKKVWRTSPTWPPAGAHDEPWYLRAGHALSPGEPDPEAGADVYSVDFTASSGVLARYRSPVDLSKTAYPDRAIQDRELAVFDSAPASAPIEITGDPVAHLTLASSRPDGEVIVYLEDVEPKGEVIYLTEGLLRLAHRKAAGGAAISGDSLHSYLAADAAPMIPGRAEPVAIALSPISVVIAKGHKIRVAIAGADAGNLERLPVAGPETFTLQRGPASPSFIDLPIVAAR
jgi:hypothetical protein